MALCLLTSFIDLYNITEALKSVKREAYRKDHMQYFHGIVPVEELCDSSKVGIEKIVILEYKQHKTRGKYAYYQKPSLVLLILSLFYAYPGKIIYEDKDEQDQDIGRYKSHVKDAARN